MRPSPRRPAVAALLFAALLSFASGAEAQGPGIVGGRSMRLSGNYTFVFNTGGGVGAVTWTVDRETLDDNGTRTRSNGVASDTGATATFSLAAVSGSETLYYLTASNSGTQDTDTVQVFPSDTKTWFTYRSAGNPDVRVYAVFPSSLTSGTRVLMAMHGNSRTASEYADIWRSWATAHDYIVLCPYYDLEKFPTTGMYHMGNVFSGDDCDGTLNPEERWTFTMDLGVHQRVREGFAIADPRFDMWGFSGGGQHVHRFMLFKPDAPVRLAISAGSGWYTAPDLAVGCPYGLADSPLAFSQPKLVDWTNRNMIIMVGTADTLRDAELRTTARADAQGRNRYERAGYMLSRGQALNPFTRWQRIDVPGTGHSAKPMAQAAQSVLQASLADVPVIPLPGFRPRGPVVRVSPNPLAGSASLSGEGWGSDPVELEVYDLAGRKVGAGIAPSSDGEWRLEWSALGGGQRIARGIYLIRARDGAQQATQKVVVTE